MLYKDTKIVWLTGISGVGKTYYSNIISEYCENNNYEIKCFDGDTIREKYKSSNSFTYDEIKKNNLFISDLCKKEIGKVDIVAVSVISPFEKVRQMIKDIFDDDIYFVYVYASIDSLKERDSKCLYKNADKGIIDNVIGYSDTLKYEVPLNPDLKLNTSTKINPKINKSKIIAFIKNEVLQ